MKLRRNALVIGLIWFSCCAWFPSSGFAGGDQVQYFPHLAFGGGYDSIWQFTGLGAGTATVTVEFFAQNGLPMIVPTDTAPAAYSGSHWMVLRSIDYLQSDLLVVFRIVRIDSDGSVILVWRKLATYPVPHYQ